jgi:hypothetical protein
MSDGKWLFFTILILILFFVLCYFSSFIGWNVNYNSIFHTPNSKGEENLNFFLETNSIDV